MIKNKKGLSAVVTTLIIILLVLVAIGIVWVVVRNIVEEGTSEVAIKVKCLDVDVRAIAVNCTDPAACSVTVKRNAGGEEIAGVKLVFYEGATGGNVVSYDQPIVALATTTITGTDSGLTTPDKVEVTAYFKNDAGEEQICGQSNSFTF